MSADRTSRTPVRHRCQALHTIYGLVALFAGTGVLLQQPVMVLFALPMGFIALQVIRLVNGRAHADGTEGTAQKQAVGAGASRLRRTWTVAAGLLDTVLILCALNVCVILLRGAGAALLPTGSVADYLVLVGGVLFTAAHTYAHRKAAGPARTDA
ncbi:hypothetical protein ABZ896_11670 [Streptomyces sp. NPDC047072]|uniref:hypothetical protein n=1 Tax=Streptomyces sp. NPDC047072 TaxID=3154809 RepID=UPI0033E2AF8A